MSSSGNDSRIDPARVKAAAAELALAGPLSVARIAAHLGTTSRTLQRHLSEQDVSVREIVDEARLEIARVLLCKTDLSIQDIAARVGYSTPSGLARAFARWTGRSPRAYRKDGPSRR
jgi:AraC-like DNA-binding protein